MDKKHCKWYNDEFCTNGDSPCVADYCPCVEYPELCKFRERETANDLANVVNNLVNEEYKPYGKTYFETADKIKELKMVIENPQVSVGDKFRIVAKYMEIMELILRVYGIR